VKRGDSTEWRLYVFRSALTLPLITETAVNGQLTGEACVDWYTLSSIRKEAHVVKIIQTYGVRNPELHSTIEA